VQIDKGAACILGLLCGPPSARWPFLKSALPAIADPGESPADPASAAMVEAGSTGMVRNVVPRHAAAVAMSSGPRGSRTLVAAAAAAGPVATPR
jgi:hypothetical protein